MLAVGDDGDECVTECVTECVIPIIFLEIIIGIINLPLYPDVLITINILTVAVKC